MKVRFLFLFFFSVTRVLNENVSCVIIEYWSGDLLFHCLGLHLFNPSVIALFCATNMNRSCIVMNPITLISIVWEPHAKTSIIFN